MRIFLIVISTLFVFSAHATLQTPDRFYYKGRVYDSDRDVYLLEKYLEAYPERNPLNMGRYFNISTSLSRGYVATYEFKDDQLFLKDVDFRKIQDTTVKAKKILYGPLKEIKISWFSGLVILPTGTVLDNTDYDNYPESRVYDKYTLFLVEQGNVTKQQEINYEQFNIRIEKHFESYKQTEDYEEFYEYELIKSYAKSEDHKKRFELWNDEEPVWNDPTVDVYVRYKAKQKRNKEFRDTEEYKDGLEEWKEMPGATADAQKEVRVLFQVFHVRTVFTDPEVITYYMP